MRGLKEILRRVGGAEFALIPGRLFVLEDANRAAPIKYGSLLSVKLTSVGVPGLLLSPGTRESDGPMAGEDVPEPVLDPNSSELH